MFDNYRRSTITLPAIGRLPRPHLLCDERDIAALRARITAGRPRALWNRLQANCEMFQDPASPHCIDVVYREKELNQRVFRAIAELAFADLIEGKRSRGEFAAKVFARVVSPGHVEHTWLFKHPGGRHLKPEGLSFGGVFLTDMTRANMDMTLGIAYDLCAPFMDEAQRSVVRDFIFGLVQLEWDHRWRRTKGANNRPPRIQMDPATNALALWGDVENPILGRFPVYAAPVVEDYLDEAYYSDGVPGEGKTYGGCLCYVMNFAHMLNRKGIKHGILDPRPAMKRMALFYYLSRDPGDVAFSLAKCEPLEMRAYNMWLQIARFFNVPLARWWWRRRFDALCESPDMAPFEGGHKERNHLVSAMLFCDDDEPEQSPQELGLSASHHFFRRGVVVARQDHAEETPVFRLLGGSNVVNQGMQQHWDSLSISLSAYGQRLIVDPGSDRTVNNSNWLATEAHSSILINGKGQETLCGTRVRPTMFDADTDMAYAVSDHCLRSRPALIQWHEREGEIEYIMASAVNAIWGIVADGYGDCRTAERHAIVIHKAATPFYVVVCDIFDYPQDIVWRNPSLDIVLIAAADTTLRADANGALIQGPRAGLRADIVTSENVTCRVDDKIGDLACSRVVWSRKGQAGRMLTVLTPFTDRIEMPTIQLLEDTEQRTACSIVFDDHEDRITFLAPRPAIETDESHRLKSGLRLRMTRRQRQQQYAQFLIPPNPGPYIVD